MSNMIKVDFNGPYKLVGQGDLLFNSDISKDKGIYLWTFEFNDGYLVEYVGETKNSFFTRTKEHMIHILGGNYRILDSNTLRRGEAKVIWNGMWRKGTKGKIGEFINKYLELSKYIFEYVSVMSLKT